MSVGFSTPVYRFSLLFANQPADQPEKGTPAPHHLNENDRYARNPRTALAANLACICTIDRI